MDHSLNYCILASDGVWDALKLDDVSKIVNENKNNFNNITKIIVETAKERGSEDNISCIVIELNKKLSKKNKVFFKKLICIISSYLNFYNLFLYSNKFN